MTFCGEVVSFAVEMEENGLLLLVARNDVRM